MNKEQKLSGLYALVRKKEREIKEIMKKLEELGGDVE